MDETKFTLEINPSQEAFEQVVKYTGETEDWGFQLSDYKFWRDHFDYFWLVTILEVGTDNLVASISLAQWETKEDTLFSIGMFYCMPKYRGQGLCKPLFKRVMDIVEDRNATLTGVVKMSPKYASEFGFDKMPDFWHLFSGIHMKDVIVPDNVSDEFACKHWEDVELNNILAYDRTICTRNRDFLMKGWFKQADTFTRVVLNKSGNIVGFGTIRIVSRNKLSVAPFYVDCLDAAEVLYKGLLDNIPQWEQYDKIGFLYPEVNTDVIKLMVKFAKNKEAISTVPFIKSQFTKKFIPSPNEKVYSMSDCAHQFV